MEPLVLAQSADESFYLAFVVALHVATALALLVYFRDEWVRVISGFLRTLRTRRIETADERMAWLLVGERACDVSRHRGQTNLCPTLVVPGGISAQVGQRHPVSRKHAHAASRWRSGRSARRGAKAFDDDGGQTVDQCASIGSARALP